MSLEIRINDLESRLAFQDDTIQALNDVLVDQQNQFGSEDNQPPPHY